MKIATLFLSCGVFCFLTALVVFAADAVKAPVELAEFHAGRSFECELLKEEGDKKIVLARGTFHSQFPPRLREGDFLEYSLQFHDKHIAVLDLFPKKMIVVKLKKMEVVVVKRNEAFEFDTEGFRDEHVLKRVAFELPAEKAKKIDAGTKDFGKGVFWRVFHRAQDPLSFQLKVLLLLEVPSQWQCGVANVEASLSVDGQTSDKKTLVPFVISDGGDCVSAANQLIEALRELQKLDAQLPRDPDMAEAHQALPEYKRAKEKVSEAVQEIKKLSQ